MLEKTEHTIVEYKGKYMVCQKVDLRDLKVRILTSLLVQEFNPMNRKRFK